MSQDTTPEIEDGIVLSESVADQHQQFVKLSKNEDMPVTDRIAAGNFALKLEKAVRERGPVVEATNADYYGEDLGGASRTLREILRLDKKKQRVRKRS